MAKIIAAKNFIDSNYSEPLTLEEIASSVSISKFHFTRQFKRIYGRSPWQYLIEVRNKKARELLANGVSISDACLSVGYESTTSFTRLFKRMTGRTPGKLKNSNFG